MLRPAVKWYSSVFFYDEFMSLILQQISRITKSPCTLVDEGKALLLDIVEPEGQRPAVGEDLLLDFDGIPRISDIVLTGVCPYVER
jgi:hypothetical protein